MQELEKILEEIELKKEKCLGVVKVEIDPMEIAIHREQYKGLRMAEDIIRKHLDDGWISVEERLPEVFGKYWATIRYDDGRTSEPVVVDFRGVRQEYVVNTPNGREYETWGIDSAFHGSRVIAWRPYYIPETYRPEQPETCKYTGGSCCWPIDQCSDCPNHPERSGK